MKNVLISACLYGTPCRYDGGNNLIEKLDLIKEKCHLFPFCPECAGGLSTPRNPSEIKCGRVIMNDGRDVTAQFERGASLALEFAEKNDCTAALMKAKSPSCGAGKVYDGSFSKTLIHGDGVTAGLLKNHAIAVFNETELDEFLSYISEE